MSWNSYWVQWVVQNVLPPSFWTLLAVTASHMAHRRRSKQQHAELIVRQELGHRELARHVAEQRDELSRQLTVHCSDIKDHVTAQTPGPRPGDRM